YEMDYDPKELRWVFTHLLSDRYNLEHGVYDSSAGTHRHHLDWNKRNNNPENIMRLTKEEHLAHHAANPELQKQTRERLDAEQRKYWRQEANRLLQSERTRRFLKEHPETLARLSAIGK